MSLSEDVLNFMLMQKATIGVQERFLLKSEVIWLVLEKSRR